MTYRARNISIAVALAIGAALLVTLYVKNSGSSSSIGKGLVSVFVASHDIEPGTPGSEIGSMVRPEQVPQAVPGAIANPNQVNGLVATDRIYSGEQVTARNFQPLTTEGTQGQIAGTTRAFQLAGDVNQLLVGTLKDGDHVDMLANLTYQPGNFRGAPVTTAQSNLVASRIVLRNIRVLKGPEQPSGGGIGNNNGWAVVLALTDTQAQKLFFVTKNGDWSLQLRPIHGAIDSPDSVETTGSVLVDGLKGPQFAQLILGPKGPSR